MARVALYLRVSTGEQTTANQRHELEAWATAAGHTIVAVYEDAGISGARGPIRQGGSVPSLTPAGAVPQVTWPLRET